MIKSYVVGLLLICLGCLDLYAIGYYNVVPALYTIRSPIEAAPAVMLFVGIALMMGAMGFYLLVSGNNKSV